MNPYELTGKRVLVTGASSGIGRACAIAASKMGAVVVLTGRRVEALGETCLRCFGKSHITVAGDITAPDFVRNLVEKAGKIDGLVHAAGIAPMCPIGMLTDDHVETVMKTNFRSFLELMKYYCKKKYRSDHLSVVAVSSVSSTAGWAGGTAYCGSKGALSSSVRALAMELASKGIRVNAVCPSNIRTPLYETGASDMNDEGALMELLKKQPLGLGEPEQVAWPVCFLLSDAASFITGVNLPVDGGYLAQ
jgi:NAD(P)-dependent dehydrogenase (short-subunit alcohol dehydrogenase family)